MSYSRDFLLGLSTHAALPARNARRKAFYFKILDLDSIRKTKKLLKIKANSNNCKDNYKSNDNLTNNISNSNIALKVNHNFKLNHNHNVNSKANSNLNLNFNPNILILIYLILISYLIN